MSYLNSFYKWIILETKNKIQLEIDCFWARIHLLFQKGSIFLNQICRNLMKNKGEKEKFDFE